MLVRFNQEFYFTFYVLGKYWNYLIWNPVAARTRPMCLGLYMYNIASPLLWRSINTYLQLGPLCLDWPSRDSDSLTPFNTPPIPLDAYLQQHPPPANHPVTVANLSQRYWIRTSRNHQLGVFFDSSTQYSTRLSPSGARKTDAIILQKK